MNHAIPVEMNDLEGVPKGLSKSTYDGITRFATKLKEWAPMATIFVPTKTAEDWRALLAKPDLHWKTGFSAKALAHCWQEAVGFPLSVQKALDESNLKDTQLLFAFPEWKTPLPGGRTASQSDIYAIAKCSDGLISIAIEGKANEGFGQTVSEWKKDSSDGKTTRLDFLVRMLALQDKEIGEIRYQLLHRTVSALLEAHRITAQNALLLIHSFGEKDESFRDFTKFVALYGLPATKNSVIGPIEANGINLFFGWITGDQRFLDK